MDVNMTKILIIVIKYIPFKEKSYYEFPLGLAYISACLKRAGYNVDVLNLNHYDENQSDLIKEKLCKGNYKYVLTGGLSAHYRQIKSIISDVKGSGIGATVIIGGGVVTSTPILMYNELSPDYMVLGEGEETIVELINKLNNEVRDLGNIKGIGYRDSSGELVITPSRSPIMDLDSLPLPDLEGFEFEKYLDMQRPNDNLYLYINDKPSFYPIISSRGCPYNCTFCYHPLGQKYRSRSIDNFINEVKYVTEKYKVNNLAIFDELLSADRKRLFDICERFKNLPRKINWMCQLRVDNIDYEMLKIMKDAGCFIISYGFESASDSILKSMKKNITISQIERAMDLTRKAGIGIQGYFIFGDPAETSETACETLDFWTKHKDYHITMGYIRPYPGSVLWKREITSNKLNSTSEQLNFLDHCILNPPNLTKMNEREWFELQKNVQKALITNDHFGELIDSKKRSENNHSIVIRCPHCKEIITYNNFHQRILGVFKLACRNCNQAMNMTPLAFKDTQDDYARNITVYEAIKSACVPVTITPCMNEAEFMAMREIYLENVNIVSFMDLSEEKAKKQYMGRPVFKRDAENIASFCKNHYFVIPLTRFANRIFAHLISLGVDRNRICRLDEILLNYSKLAVEDFAAIFGTTNENIPQIAKEVICNSDFRYQILSGSERDNTLLRVVKTLLSDTLKQSGPHRKKDWEKGWTENFSNFISHGYDIKELIPKFVRKKEVVRFKGEYIMPSSPDFETNFVKILRYYLFSKYFVKTHKIFEFGCGTGLNLIAVSELFKQKELYGLDWSEASCQIINELAHKLDLNLSGIVFDMFNPNFDVEVDNKSAVFTIGAMEQLGTDFMPFTEFLLKKKPSIIINVEVNYESHDKSSLFDFLAAAYIEKRNYLRGFFAYLNELEKQGRVDILEIRKTIGGLYHDGYAYTVWKPRN